MAEWVRKQMIKWGEWTVKSGRGSSNGLAAYPAYNLVHIRSTAGGIDPVDLEVLQIDRAMAEIQVSKPDLYEVGYEVYVKTMTYTELASRLGCHRNTVTARLNALHIAVEKLITICTTP